jgi:hypothetical protein
MEPPSEPEQEIAALQAENVALKKRVAALEARRAELEELERQADQALPQVKGRTGPSDPAGCD